MSKTDNGFPSTIGLLFDCWAIKPGGNWLLAYKMMKLELAPVQKTLLGAFIGPVLLTLIIVEIFHSLTTSSLLTNSQATRGRIITRNLAQGLGDSMLVGEWDKITKQLQELHDFDPEVAYILLLKPDGQCQVSVGQDKKDKVLNQTDRKEAIISL